MPFISVSVFVAPDINFSFRKEKGLYNRVFIKKIRPSSILFFTALFINQRSMLVETSQQNTDIQMPMNYWKKTGHRIICCNVSIFFYSGSSSTQREWNAIEQVSVAAAFAIYMFIFSIVKKHCRSSLDFPPTF